MTKKRNQPDDAGSSARSGKALRRRAEEIVLGKGGPEDLTSSLIVEDSRKLLHDLQIHQVELEMQNDELRRVQEELESSRARYFDLYDMAPVGYVTFNDKGKIVEANLTLATMLGVTRGALVNQPLSRFVYREDQDVYYRFRKELVDALSANEGCPGGPSSSKGQAGGQCVHELRMTHNDSTAFWVRVEAAVALDADGAPLFRAVLIDITKSKNAEDKIAALLAEKEMLLQETHHRIKNNLSTIASLLDLQAEEADPAVAAILTDAKDRLRSMGILYDKLYRSNTFSSLSIGDYLPSLADEIAGNFPGKADMIYRIDDFMLDSKTAFPLGIILYELITNAMKYAFSGGAAGEDVKGMITLTASMNEGLVKIAIEDNGRGMPDSINLIRSPGFGLQLVEILTKQLGGSIRIERGGGTRFVLEFGK